MIPILSVRNLSTGYGKEQVLFDVSFDLMPGEMVLITGGNGSGKSTLFKAIYGLLPAWNADAEIVFRPNPHTPALSTQVPAHNLLKGLAYLPQKNAVFDDLTVEENLQLAGYTLPDAQEFAARRDEVLVALPALQPLHRRKAETLSGGERQQVALGMTLLHRPKLLLLDEPLSGLDAIGVGQILSLVKDLHARFNLSLLFVEHRQTANVDYFSRALRLRLGRLSSNDAHEPS